MTTKLNIYINKETHSKEFEKLSKTFKTVYIIGEAERLVESVDFEFYPIQIEMVDDEVAVSDNVEPLTANKDRSSDEDNNSNLEFDSNNFDEDSSDYKTNYFNMKEGEDDGSN